jgi:hypothetical protein
MRATDGPDSSSAYDAKYSLPYGQFHISGMTTTRAPAEDALAVNREALSKLSPLSSDEEN